MGIYLYKIKLIIIDECGKKEIIDLIGEFRVNEFFLVGLVIGKCE